ncbi:MAG TPA: hypothetical protein VFB62_20465 [Polyangiaceae bacterium]|nr:hypothetical protein [Polyangiaceae bacterium]
MALRKAHGNGAEALVRVETPPVDELGPGDAPDMAGLVQRRPDGTLTKAGARVLGRLAGLRSAEKRRFAAVLADQLGLVTVPEHLKPYVDVATDFARAEVAKLGSMFGDIGPGPSSMVQSAALALAASRAAYADGDGRTGARLADQSRQLLLTAHHLAELERKSAKTAPWWLGTNGGKE